jgi:hypothetical protein
MKVQVAFGSNCGSMGPPREGKRDMLLWFDKATNLLLNREYRGADPWAPQAAEANNEKYYSDYKAVDGV